MKTAIETAKWFILNNRSIDSSSFDGNAKLQKLLYYTQAMSLAALDEPFFSDEIEAWENGPVVRDVYSDYKYNALPAMTTLYKEKLSFTGPQLQLLKIVDYLHGGKTARELIDETHRESPWKNLEELACSRRNPVISQDSIKDYFKDFYTNIYEAYKDYDFDSEKVDMINGAFFTYNIKETELNEEDLIILQDLGLSNPGVSFFVYKDDEGKLVAY